MTMNDYEKEYTGRFEGTYSAREVELNNHLHDECIRETPDYGKIEELLKQGADPLGATAVSGWGLLEHIYGEILCDTQHQNSKNLPRITELFLKYGMDIDNPRVPYDGENSINPMWEFAFAMNENSVHALKMLLDHQLSADSAGQMWSHAIGDLDLFCEDPCDHEFWNYECTWVLKMMMLCASYAHVLNNDEGLQKLIHCDHNTYDLRYEFVYRSIVKIYEKSTGKLVWRFQV